MYMRFIAKRMRKSLMKLENMGEHWCLRYDWKNEFEIYSTVCWDSNSYSTPKDKALACFISSAMSPMLKSSL